MPFRPGMCTSRKTTCGACCSNSSTASRPLRASATTSSSGHRRARCAAQALAQQRLVVGDQRGRAVMARPGAGRRRGRAVGASGSDLGAHAVRRGPRAARAGRRRRRSRAAARAGSSARCRAAPTSRMPTPVSATDDADRAVGRRARRADLDAAAVLARVDAVADGVLDQRQQRHRRKAQRRRAPAGTSIANSSRSGMRICISSR